MLMAHSGKVQAVFEFLNQPNPDGGPVLWLELPKRVNLDSLMNNLRDQGVLIQLPTFAFFQAPHSHGFKIGYAFLSQPEMEQGIEKLSKEIKRQMSV